MSERAYKDEVDEVYSLIIDYESDLDQRFDDKLAPRVRELFEKVYQQGWQDALKSVMKDGL